MCLYVFVSVQECRPEEGVRSPRAGITGSCELPDVGAGHRTRVLLEQYILLTVERLYSPEVDYFDMRFKSWFLSMLTRLRKKHHRVT